MGAKKRLLVAIAVGVILVLAFTFFRLKATPPITDIAWEANIPKYIDISWSDKETQVYTIFWSNQPGINIRKRSTYRHSMQTTNFQEGGRNFARIYSPYEWVYFVIVKDNFKSKEIEARTKPNTAFTCENLSPRVLEMCSESGQMTIRVAVLDDAETYVLQRYLPDGSVAETEFDVKGMQIANLKFPVVPETMGYLAMKKSAETSAPEFLFLSEKLSSGLGKWETATRLC